MTEVANPNGNPQNLVHWEKGKSGNPAGRPKRKSFIELLHEHIEAQDSEKELIGVFHKMLLAANQYAWKEYLERRDGKVKDELQIDEKRPEINVTFSSKHADRHQSTTGTTNGFSGQ
jgi:hypothetical protein